MPVDRLIFFRAESKSWAETNNLDLVFKMSGRGKGKAKGTKSDEPFGDKKSLREILGFLYARLYNRFHNRKRRSVGFESSNGNPSTHLYLAAMLLSSDKLKVAQEKRDVISGVRPDGQMSKGYAGYEDGPQSNPVRNAIVRKMQALGNDGLANYREIQALKKLAIVKPVLKKFDAD